MFAAASEGGPARGTRSSRRRQRPVSSDSVAQQPKAKRQRLPLSETTFVNPDAAPEMYEVKLDKINLLGIKRDGIETFAAAPRKELSVRSKKPKAGERVSKGDGSIVLTTNNAYTVSKLPALPDRIRNDPQNRQHGSVDSSNEYALTLTHTHAVVWPYKSTTPSPESFVFALPYPSKHATDPLPLGSLVAPSAASDEPGLVAVMPLTGRITYWESVSSATLEFIREQQTGVEGAVPGMFSGEHVTQIINADSVGFVLAFSSGRLAHMNVRDGHGRPGISVQFFRNSPSHNTGGFFGSLRSALSSSALKGHIAAVRAGPALQIGERVIVAATSKAKLHSWKVHRSGNHDPLAEVDIRDDVANALKEADPSLVDVPNELIEVVDFAFVPTGLEEKYVNASKMKGAHAVQDDSVQHLLLLAVFSTKPKPRHSLVEVVIQAGACRIGVIRHLQSYKSPIKSSAPERPRLYLPRPGLVAFVVFDRAVVVASLASVPGSSGAQLPEEGNSSPSTFEDVIDFEDVNHVQIVGSGMEEPAGSGAEQEDDRSHRHHKAKNHPAAVLLIQGVGVVRVTIPDIDRFASGKPPEVTAKSKLEQAVFFGIKNDNPLVFRGRRVLPFSDRDIGNAAVELSHEIVSSKTAYMANTPPSLENNLKTRLVYLNRLISHLNALEVKLDERIKWMLLYNAEKTAVAIWIWQKAEEFLAQRPKTRASKNLVAEIIMCINESQKTEPRRDIGEVDPVRHWFLNDVWRMDHFLAWCYQIIKQTWVEGNTDEGGINRLLWEAMTVETGALRKAFEYRQTHIELYGLPSPVNEGGEVKPVPWTSAPEILNKNKRLIELCYQWLGAYYREPGAKIEVSLLSEIRAMLPTLTGQYFKILHEYITWAKKTSDARVKDLSDLYANDMVPKILSLKDYDLWDEAINLAIQFESWESLAKLVTEQIYDLEERAKSRSISASEAKDLVEKADAKKQQLGNFIDTYKKDFASCAYSCLLERCGLQDVLDFPYGKKEFKTSFLREKPELAKVSWINDVEQENDIEQAAETLLDLGIKRELQVWNKKIELSLGKLALLTQDSAEQAGSETVSSRQSHAETRNGVTLEKIDQELAIIKIQDGLYNQILPSIIDAVDEAAAVELAIGRHMSNLAKQQKKLKHIFEHAMRGLLRHEVLPPMDLIDLLTLVLLDKSYVEEIGDQFFLALKVAENSLKDSTRADAQRLIWRRCYLRDNWKEVNLTNLKNDRAVLGDIGETALWSTLYSILAEDPTQKSSPPIIKPTEVVGVFTETLDRRFDALSEDEQNQIIEVMKWEDQQLHNFINKHRLEYWQASTLTEARNTVELAYARQNEDGAIEEDSGALL